MNYKVKWEKEAREFFEKITPWNKRLPSGDEWPIEKSHTLSAFIAGAKCALEADGLIVKRRDDLLKDIECARKAGKQDLVTSSIHRLHELDLLVECIAGDGKAMKKLIEQNEASRGRLL